MKTTIDLPDSILERTKIAAARRRTTAPHHGAAPRRRTTAPHHGAAPRRRTTIKNLVIEGLEAVLREDALLPPPSDALARLRHGYHLGGQPLTREETHAS